MVGAKRIFVITSGQVVVCVTQPGEQRCVAVRGAGDIVGERAALEVRPRSATVVALVAAEALVITTSDFVAFIQRHPRVLAVLERQVYDRLVEDRPGEPKSLPADVATVQPAWSGLNCSIFLADISAFGRHSRNDKDRRLLRALMYDALQHAFENSGVPWHSCHREDRGDGVLLIVPPSTPTSLLIDPLSGRPRHGPWPLPQLPYDRITGNATESRATCGTGDIGSGRCVRGIHHPRRPDPGSARAQAATGPESRGSPVSSSTAYVHDTVVKHAPGDKIEPHSLPPGEGSAEGITAQCLDMPMEWWKPRQGRVNPSVIHRRFPPDGASCHSESITQRTLLPS